MVCSIFFKTNFLCISFLFSLHLINASTNLNLIKHPSRPLPLRLFENQGPLDDHYQRVKAMQSFKPPDCRNMFQNVACCRRYLWAVRQASHSSRCASLHPHWISLGSRRAVTLTRVPRSLLWTGGGTLLRLLTVRAAGAVRLPSHFHHWIHGTRRLHRGEMTRNKRVKNQNAHFQQQVLVK